MIGAVACVAALRTAILAVWDYFVLASCCVMSHQGWVKAVCLQHAVLELWLDYE